MTILTKTQIKGFCFLLAMLMKDKKKQWRGSKYIFVSPFPMSRRGKEKQFVCYSTSYPLNVFENIFLLIFLLPLHKKAQSFASPTLLCLRYGTVRMGSEHSYFWQKTCACSGMNICMIIHLFFFILLSCKSFVWKLLKLS